MNKINADMSHDDIIIASALNILEKRISYSSDDLSMTSPAICKEYVKLHLARYEHEVFACLWLDNRNRVINFNKVFRGTIDVCSVHSREIVKNAMKHNAAAVILAHNHPSGVSEPSAADRRITERLINALALIYVRVLDHFIVSGSDSYSFAESGLL